MENPQDLADLRAAGIDAGARFAVIGGSGVDTDSFPLLPPAQGEMPVAAFVGDMVAASGVDVLVRAFDRMWARGVRLKLELVGAPPEQDPDAVPADQLTLWGLRPGVHLPGPLAADVREVWRRAEICVLPALGRLGTPRALLAGRRLRSRADRHRWRRRRQFRARRRGRLGGVEAAMWPLSPRRSSASPATRTCACG